jgi:hypothetical protein
MSEKAQLFRASARKNRWTNGPLGPCRGSSRKTRFSAGGTFSSTQTPAERLNFNHGGAGSRSIPGNAEECGYSDGLLTKPAFTGF